MKKVIVSSMFVLLAIVMIAVHKNHPNRSFFQSWQTSYDSCVNMCNNHGQDYSKVLLYGMGGCMCDNEEGRRMSCGYLKYNNSKISPKDPEMVGLGCK